MIFLCAQSAHALLQVQRENFIQVWRTLLVITSVPVHRPPAIHFSSSVTTWLLTSELKSKSKDARVYARSIFFKYDNDSGHRPQAERPCASVTWTHLLTVLSSLVSNLFYGRPIASTGSTITKNAVVSLITRL